MRWSEPGHSGSGDQFEEPSDCEQIRPASSMRLLTVTYQQEHRTLIRRSYRPAAAFDAVGGRRSPSPRRSSASSGRGRIGAENH